MCSTPRHVGAIVGSSCTEPEEKVRKRIPRGCWAPHGSYRSFDNCRSTLRGQELTESDWTWTQTPTRPGRWGLTESDWTNQPTSGADLHFGRGERLDPLERKSPLIDKGTSQQPHLLGFGCFTVDMASQLRGIWTSSTGVCMRRFADLFTPILLLDSMFLRV